MIRAGSYNPWPMASPSPAAAAARQDRRGAAVAVAHPVPPSLAAAAAHRNHQEEVEVAARLGSAAAVALLGSQAAAAHPGAAAAPVPPGYPVVAARRALVPAGQSSPVVVAARERPYRLSCAEWQPRSRRTSIRHPRPQGALAVERFRPAARAQWRRAVAGAPHRRGRNSCPSSAVRVVSQDVPHNSGRI